MFGLSSDPAINLILVILVAVFILKPIVKWWIKTEEESKSAEIIRKVHEERKAADLKNRQELNKKRRTEGAERMRLHAIKLEEQKHLCPNSQ